MAAAAILFTSAMTSAVRLGPLSTICYAVPYYSCRRADTPVLVMGVEDGPTTTSFRQRLKAVNVDRHVLAAAAALHNEWGRPRGPRRESEGGNGMVHLGSAYGVRPRFLAAASTEASIPPAGLPEVAVIGRSNVGKSSLLNVLTGSSGLARVSDKPGRTTQLCWFEVGKRGNPDAFYLVDMPGYGFALASEKSVEQWAELSAAYLRKRSTLKMVLVLIDSRVGMKLTDVQMIEFLEQQTKVKYMVVMTKCDVAGPPQRLAQVAGLVQAGLKSTRRQVRPIALVSSSRKAGIDNLQRRIIQAATGRTDLLQQPGAAAGGRGGGRVAGRGLASAAVGSTQRGRGSTERGRGSTERGRGSTARGRGGGRGGGQGYGRGRGSVSARTARD